MSSQRNEMHQASFDEFGETCPICPQSMSQIQSERAYKLRLAGGVRTRKAATEAPMVGWGNECKEPSERRLAKARKQTLDRGKPEMEDRKAGGRRSRGLWEARMGRTARIWRQPA